MTTQIVDFVADITKRLIILHKGKVVAHDTPSGIKRLAGNPDGSLEEAVTILTEESKGCKREDVSKGVF